MKHIIRISFILAAVFITIISTAFAAPATKSVIMDDSFDLSSIHTIAIAMPNYIQTNNSPKIGDVTAILAQNGFDSRRLKNITIIPYSVIANSIKKDTNIDLQKVDRHTAESVFQKNIKKYADAYLVLTVANNSRVVLFYDLYSAKTNDYLYSYKVIGGGQSDNNLKKYEVFNDMFYDTLAQTIKDQHK
ncbi:hypothetical protein [Pectinatus sottacetonis]|uniref:hypothetical protein n=1 Tax=Pectinatus sottacetonis TaxID=1002795 RepID=UPI0018C7180F|nr:hypothetical protein [Pectinatus sottacetonis]